MAEIIFISITLSILVGITIYLKVPKASIPLFAIYLIFIIKNQSSDKPNELNVDHQDISISKNSELLRPAYVDDNGTIYLKGHAQLSEEE